MEDKLKKRNELNQSGQAIFEFIIFIPFLVFLYMMFYTIGSSISGSINQQKAVRGYFYSLVKNNSYILSKKELDELRSQAIKKAGFFSIGWAERIETRSQYANCFQFSSMIKGSNEEECDDSKRETEGSSMFIRMFTAYGVCGGIFIDQNGVFNYNPMIQSDAFGCSLSK
jgi:hypothetical protein